MVINYILKQLTWNCQPGCYRQGAVDLARSCDGYRYTGDNVSVWPKFTVNLRCGTFEREACVGTMATFRTESRLCGEFDCQESNGIYI